MELLSLVYSFGIVVTIGLQMPLVNGGSSGFFEKVTEEVLRGTDTRQKNYGIAVADVDHDGQLDWIIAGYSRQGRGAPNIVLKYDQKTKTLMNIAKLGTAFENLMDEGGAAIGVCACDLDGDGKEEIYFLNTNGAFGGKATYGDKLFKWRDGRYVDLFSDPVNQAIGATMYAGRSVACVDRLGTGKYAFALATYAWGPDGNFGLIEMDEMHPQNRVSTGNIVLKNVAQEAGIAKPTGGRGITVGPIINTEGKSDIFFDNEGGANFLFKNNGNGTFTDVAEAMGIADPSEHGRGVALADFNGDEMLDIVYGNWMGPHRLFLQKDKGNGRRKFRDIATRKFAEPSAARTVITADFDNNGELEILINNIVYSDRRTGQKLPQPNRLFSAIMKDDKVKLKHLDIGDAEEPMGYGTGGAAADIDGDGVLEVILAHGESGEQSLDVYHVRNPGGRFLRVAPQTVSGAPARGGLVTIKMADGSKQSRVIDGGSGYLCEMEPVAHFGLGNNGQPIELKVIWPDGQTYTTALSQDSVNKVHTIPHPTARKDNTSSMNKSPNRWA